MIMGLHISEENKLDILGFNILLCSISLIMLFGYREMLG
jgi:hypothetical protein